MAMPNEFHPTGSQLIGLVSLVPLLLLVSFFESYKQALRWGGIWGIGFTMVQYFWLSRFGDFSLWTLAGVSVVYFAYGSVFLVALHWGITYKHHLQPIVLAMIITTFDYLRSIGYLAFPWNLLAHPFSRNLYMIQSAEIGGVFLIIFLIAYTQGFLFMIVSGWISKPIHSYGYQDRSFELVHHGIFLLLLWVGNGSFGAIVLHDSHNGRFTDVELDLILVQQNQDSWAIANREQGMIDLQNLTLVAKQAEPIIISGEDINQRPFQPDLVVWSETSLTFTPESILNASDRFPQSFPFKDFLGSLTSPILTGAPVYFDPQNPQKGLMNGAVVFIEEHDSLAKELQISDLEIPKGNWVIAHTYGKMRLIPFAEHVPTGDLPFLSRFLEEQIGISGSGWQVGTSLEPFHLDLYEGSVAIGVPICFEDSFFQHTRAMALAGSNLFINLTNNSWSGTFTAHGQHTAAMVFRSIETRRPMIRSTNSGLTSIIDNHGRIIWSLPEFETIGVGIRVVLSIPETFITFYTYWGDWFALLCLVILSFIFLADTWDSLPKNLHRHKKTTQ
jgi:apolipoprotein N-acyltransferase